MQSTFQKIHFLLFFIVVLFCAQSLKPMKNKTSQHAIKDQIALILNLKKISQLITIDAKKREKYSEELYRVAQRLESLLHNQIYEKLLKLTTFEKYDYLTREIAELSWTTTALKLMQEQHKENIKKINTLKFHYQYYFHVLQVLKKEKMDIEHHITNHENNTLSLSYIPNAESLTHLQKHDAKKNKQCPTHLHDHNLVISQKYSNLCFEVLEELRHPNPHIVMVYNHPMSKAACAGPLLIHEKKGRGIKMDQAYWDTKSPCLLSMTLLHEGAHLMTKDYYNPYDRQKNPTDFYKVRRQQEAQADALALKTRNCAQCALEWAKERFDNSKAKKNYIGIQTISFDTIKQLNLEQINALLEEVTALPIPDNASHPLGIERALRACKFALENPDGACGKYHQPLY